MKNKTIGLDARLWNHPGIGRYVREFSFEMVRCLKDEKFVLLGDPAPIRDFFSSRQSSSFTPACIETHSKIYSLQEQWQMPGKTSSLDLLHVPHFNIPVLLKEKLVVTIHDLIYLHESRASKSFFGKAYVSWLLKMIEKKAAAVIAVSQHTKNDLLEQFPRFSKDRVFVTYEASAPLFHKISNPLELQEVRRRYSLSRPFILFVGTLKPHKNVLTLIRALKILRETKGVEHDLVLVGRKDERNRPLLDMIKQNAFVRYLGELSDPDVAVLYNCAEVFVLPSTHEGFGLPAIEAMACGTPVIVSNRSSLPEIVGSAGLIFDPLKVDALCELLYNVLNGEELRKNMINLGLTRAREFSWRTTAEQTMEVYRKVLEG